MVEPEIGEDFFELLVGIDGAQEFAFGQVLIDYLLRSIQHGDCGGVRWGGEGEEHLALRRFPGVQDIDLRSGRERFEESYFLERRTILKSVLLFRRELWMTASRSGTVDISSTRFAAACACGDFLALGFFLNLVTLHLAADHHAG